MKPSKLRVNIENGIIKEVSNSESTEFIIDSELFTFPNGYAIPGIVDSHAHIIGLGENLNTPRLERAKSKKELLEMVQGIKINSGWITGRGWNEELWSDNSIHKSDLDSINSEIPIFLIRVDGHAAWVNSKALEIAKINQKTPNPMGGSINKDLNGIPNGLLIDNAIELVRNIIPPKTKELIKKYILDACNECLRLGITEVHDMDVHLEHIHIYKELNDDNLLPIRLVQYIRGFDGEYEVLHPKPYINNYLQIIGLKFYADGALGSRGALMLDKYNDADTFGLELISTDELYQRAKVGCENGWDIAVHAIGDKANRNVLDAYDKLRAFNFQNKLRIEHSQLINPNDISRFKKLNVIASVQPIHCTSDKNMAIKRLGENYKFAYPWQTLINSDATLIAGSDFPIESYNPYLGIDAFRNRNGKGENKTWNEEETISLEDSLKSYCVNPHLASGNGSRGSIEISKSADISVIDNDLSNNKQIKHTECLATIVNGKLTKHL